MITSLDVLCVFIIIVAIVVFFNVIFACVLFVLILVTFSIFPYLEDFLTIQTDSLKQIVLSFFLRRNINNKGIAVGNSNEILNKETILACGAELIRVTDPHICGINYTVIESIVNLNCPKFLSNFAHFIFRQFLLFVTPSFLSNYGQITDFVPGTSTKLTHTAHASELSKRNPTLSTTRVEGRHHHIDQYDCSLKSLLIFGKDLFIQYLCDRMIHYPRGCVSSRNNINLPSSSVRRSSDLSKMSFQSHKWTPGKKQGCRSSTPAMSPKSNIHRRYSLVLSRENPSLLSIQKSSPVQLNRNKGLNDSIISSSISAGTGLFRSSSLRVKDRSEDVYSIGNSGKSVQGLSKTLKILPRVQKAQGLSTLDLPQSTSPLRDIRPPTRGPLFPRAPSPATIPVLSHPGYMPVVDLSKRNRLHRSKRDVAPLQGTVKIAPPVPSQLNSPGLNVSLTDVPTLETAVPATPDTNAVVNALREKSRKRSALEEEAPPEYSNVHMSKRRKQESATTLSTTLATTLPRSEPLNMFNEPEFMPDLSVNGYSVLPLHLIGMKRPATPTVDLDPSTLLPGRPSPKRQKAAAATSDNSIKGRNQISSSLSSMKKRYDGDPATPRSDRRDKNTAMDGSFLPIEQFQTSGPVQRPITPVARRSPAVITEGGDATSTPKKPNLTLPSPAVTQPQISDPSPPTATNTRHPQPTPRPAPGQRRPLPIYSALTSNVTKVSLPELTATPEDYIRDRQLERERVQDMLRDDADSTADTSVASASAPALPASQDCPQNTTFNFSTSTVNSTASPILSSNLNVPDAISALTAPKPLISTNQQLPISLPSSVNPQTTALSAAIPSQTGVATSIFSFSTPFDVSQKSTVIPPTQSQSATVTIAAAITITTTTATPTSEKTQPSLAAIANTSAQPTNVAVANSSASTGIFSTTAAVTPNPAIISSTSSPATSSATGAPINITAFSTVQPNVAVPSVSFSFGSGAAATQSFGLPVPSAAATTASSILGSATAQSVLGAAAATAFGTITTTTPPSLFGPTTLLSAGANGTTMTQSLFGTSTSVPSLFGMPTASTGTSPLLFGSSSKPTPFGTTPTIAPPFGTAPTSTTATPSLFGSAPTSSTATPSLFGSAPTSTTATPSLFGSAPTSSTATPSLFGSAPTSSTATPSLFGSAPTSSTATPSLFGSAPTSTTATPSLFGSGPTTTASLFGNFSSAATTFSTTSAPSIFRTTANTAPVFGTTVTSQLMFGSVAPSLFGTTSTTANSIFGSTATQQPGFGTAATPTPFGATATTQSSFGTKPSSGFTFGSQTTASAPIFGTGSNVPTFGASSALPTPFGAINASTTPTFGAVSNPSNASPFGTSTTMQSSVTPFAFNVASTSSAFGTPSPFGGSAFTPASTAPSAFSFTPASTSNVGGFQQKPAAPGGFTFNNQTNAASNFTFGSSSNQTPAFGAPAANPSPFAQSAPSPSTGFMFGQSTNQPQSSAGGFNFNSNSTSFNFGTPATPAQAPGGFNFSAGTPTGATPNFSATPNSFSVGLGDTTRNRTVARGRRRGGRR